MYPALLTSLMAAPARKGLSVSLPRKLELDFPRYVAPCYPPISRCLTQPFGMHGGRHMCEKVVLFGPCLQGLVLVLGAPMWVEDDTHLG